VVRNASGWPRRRASPLKVDYGRKRTSLCPGPCRGRESRITNKKRAGKEATLLRDFLSVHVGYRPSCDARRRGSHGRYWTPVVVVVVAHPLHLNDVVVVDRYDYRRHRRSRRDRTCRRAPRSAGGGWAGWENRRQSSRLESGTGSPHASWRHHYVIVVIAISCQRRAHAATDARRLGVDTATQHVGEHRSCTQTDQ